MSYSWPIWLVSGQEIAEMRHGLRNIVGRVLRNVRYVGPQGLDDWGVCGKGLHEVFGGVLLEFADGPVYVAWINDGTREGLAIQVHDVELSPHMHVTADASSCIPWTQFLNKTVSGVGFALHSADGPASRALWAVRFDIGDLSSLVLALGQLDEKTAVIYSPDSVIVSADESLMRRYRIPASDVAAWGVDA